MRKVLIALVRVYQKILSPVMGNQCRYHPTCSAYSIEAIERHGAVKGLILTIWRILRCQPFATGPWTDPVPETFAPLRRFRYNRGTKRNHHGHGCGGICTHNKDVT